MSRCGQCKHLMRTRYSLVGTCTISKDEKYVNEKICRNFCKRRREMKVGSLFDGSGGFPLAATLCGFEPVWASEVEPFPISVTKKRFPNMKHLGNICKVNGAEIEPVDIITFGSPCQDLSLAGKRQGLSGSRSNLFFEAIRIIKEMRLATNGKYPRYAIWENVAGAFSSNKGADFLSVLQQFVGITEEGVYVPKPEKWEKAGIITTTKSSFAWRTLDAQFWGVPQRRRRIYAVADFDGHSVGEILFEPESLLRNYKQVQEAWKRITRRTEESTGRTSEDFNNCSKRPGWREDRH